MESVLARLKPPFDMPKPAALLTTKVYRDVLYA